MKCLKLFSIFLFLLYFLGCDENNDIVINEDLIFKYSYEIIVPSFVYSLVPGDTVFVRGDLSYNSEIIDTVPSTPTLAWDSINSDIYCAAIFKNSMQVENHSIVNDTSDIVWIWHSALTEGSNGLVKFEHGIKKMNILPSESLQKPDSLNIGQIYYWGVWAWNNSGTEIIFSSRELKFIVE